MLAVLITGPPGAGKSEVASSLHDSLGESGVDAAMIEVDALERSYPPIDRERSIGHLEMLARSYARWAAGLLIVTATIEDDDYMLAALAAIGADETLLVRLEADPETLRDRILAREPPGWDGLPELLNASRSLAASMPELAGVDLVVEHRGRAAGGGRGADRGGHWRGDLVAVSCHSTPTPPAPPDRRARRPRAPAAPRAGRSPAPARWVAARTTKAAAPSS